MVTVLITGGCGFIASHLVEHIHRKTDYNIKIIDKLTYASEGLERLRESGMLYSRRITVFTLDLSQPLPIGVQKELGHIDIIIHMAAETHVDNSIKEPVHVIQNNVMSTVYLLEYARTLPNLQTFLYFSTDEVYGSAPGNTAYTETDRHAPTNPYSASKSAGEQICIAYENTFSIPIIRVNVMNAFGERQHSEKFIPKCIRSIRDGEQVYIHADSTCTTSGSRFYIHARNIAAAVCFILKHGHLGELYHITGECEVSNLQMAQMIADFMGKKLIYTMVNYHEDRPGHDLRYALDGTKLFKLGWEIPVDFKQSLQQTIEWTLEHPHWL
jgi:dTDP-glucose 4,6-dehydratase